MITRVAIRHRGRVYIGKEKWRHDTLFFAHEEAFSTGGCEMGFVTDEGTYLNRYQAARHAFRCGQIPAIADSGIVYYYVESTNNKGRTSRYPAAGEWESFPVNYQPPNLKINELLAQNDAMYRDNYDEYNDWFEIYNPTDEALNLQGMYVSDDLTDPRKWRLGNLSIPAKGFLLLWADDDAEQGSNHVGFKLSGEGEQLGLFDRDENENLPIDTVSLS